MRDFPDLADADAVDLPRPREAPLSSLGPVRREARNFAGGILLLHLVAMLGWKLAGMAARPRSAQTLYGAIWTVLTLALVARGLWRVRMARRTTGSARERSAGR